MSEETAIEWTHRTRTDGTRMPGYTFNICWGCVETSPACAHCYARKFAERLGLNLWGNDAPRRFFGEKYWSKPLAWNKKATALGEKHLVFCSSMADVFEDYGYIDPVTNQSLDTERERLWKLIESTPNLIWLLLTKRPENMIRMAPSRWRDDWPSNVWALATVEDQKRADERITELMKVPAVVHGLSMEPLCGPVTLPEDFLRSGTYCPHCWKGGCLVENGCHLRCERPVSLPWVILGGESGPNARPTHPDHFRSLLDQCVENDVPVFLKQNGEWIDPGHPEFMRLPAGKMVGLRSDGHVYKTFPDDENADCVTMKRVGKHRAGRILDGRTWDQFPEVGE